MWVCGNGAQERCGLMHVCLRRTVEFYTDARTLLLQQCWV